MEHLIGGFSPCNIFPGLNAATEKPLVMTFLENLALAKGKLLDMRDIGQLTAQAKPDNTPQKVWLSDQA